MAYAKSSPDSGVPSKRSPGHLPGAGGQAREQVCNAVGEIVRVIEREFGLQDPDLDVVDTRHGVEVRADAHHNPR